MGLLLKLPVSQEGSALRELGGEKAAVSPKEPHHLSSNANIFMCRTEKCPRLLFFCKGFSTCGRNSKETREVRGGKRKCQAQHEQPLEKRVLEKPGERRLAQGMDAAELPLQESSVVPLARKQGCTREKPRSFISFFSKWRILNS